MSSDNYKQIVLAQIKSVLKPEGFHKKGATFSLEQNEVVLFGQLQSSVRSTKQTLIVTVNLGIFSKTVARRVGNTHKPNILEAQWGMRIGEFLPDRKDKWWELHSEDEAHRCGKEIAAVLAQTILPEMKRLASDESLKLLWQSGRSPGLTQYQCKQYLRALEVSD